MIAGRVSGFSVMDAFSVLVAYLVIGLSIATALTNAYALQRHARGVERRNHVVSRVLSVFGCLYVVAIYSFQVAGWFGDSVPPIVARPAFLALVGVLFARSLE